MDQKDSHSPEEESKQQTAQQKWTPLSKKAKSKDVCLLPFEETFLGKLKLTSFEPLRTATRKICPKCNTSKCFYCYDCLIPLCPLPDLDPLPLHVSVVRHPKEKISKSSIIAAKLIATKSISIHNYPDLPSLEELSPENTCLLFPSKDAKKIQDYSPDFVKNLSHLVIIDCTWNQTKKILTHPLVKSLPKAIIEAKETTFWRYQEVGKANLATVEALYYFMKDYAETQGEYKGQFDDLLYFYAFKYSQLQLATEKEAQEEKGEEQKENEQQ